VEGLCSRESLSQHRIDQRDEMRVLGLCSRGYPAELDQEIFDVVKGDRGRGGVEELGSQGEIIGTADGWARRLEHVRPEPDARA